MRYLFVAPMVLVLSGCWFVYIPGSLFQSDADPAANTCISEGQFVGDKIKHLATGKTGVVQKVYGKSSRCAQASHPYLAAVEFED